MRAEARIRNREGWLLPMPDGAKFPMTANETTDSAATGDCPAFVLRRRVVLSRWRAAGAAVALPAGLLRVGGRPCVGPGNGPDQRAGEIRQRDCLGCHLDPNTTRVVNGKTESLVFPTNTFAQSVHAKLDCMDCHTGIKELVHDSPLPPPDCTGCHEKEAKDYATSIHGVSHMLGASGAANCWDCHGSHDILPVKNPASPVFKLNLPPTCAKCHSNPGLTKEYQMKYPEAAAQYMDSIHGRALLKMGLIVAPSCNDCHGVHDIKRAVDRDSPINHANVAKTCGKCHVGIEQTYNQSVHGQLLAKGDQRGPVCTDCHTAHEIENPDGQQFQGRQRRALRQMPRRTGWSITATPTTARPWRWASPTSPRKSPPATTATAITTCCRRPIPRSHLSKTNILATCQQCHPGATIGFTEYKPHANPLDGKNYPLLHAVFLAMTGLLIGMFAFFGLHTARLAGPRRLPLPARLEDVPRSQDQDAGGRRMVHPLPAVRAVPAFPGRDQLPAAGHHRHAAEVLLHRLGQGDLQRHRRRRKPPARCTASAPSSPSSISACTWPR